MVGCRAELLLWAREKGTIVEADETRIDWVSSVFPSDKARGKQGADLAFKGRDVSSVSRFRLRFEGRNSIHLGYGLFAAVSPSHIIFFVTGRDSGATASRSLRQNLHSGGFVSAIPLESSVHVGGVSGAYRSINQFFSRDLHSPSI